MDREYTCFFTGHRFIRNDSRDWLTERIKNKVKYLNDTYGVTDFIAGGAMGFDTLAAEAVIAVREEIPDIRLHIYLPCRDNMKNWRNRSEIERAKAVLECADDYVYVNEKYIPGCMQARNARMAKDSAFCIAYCLRRNSGTGDALRYAEDKGLDIYNIAEDE